MPDSAQQITAIVHRYYELFDTGQLVEFAAQFGHGQWHRAEPGAGATRRWIEEHVPLHDGLPATKHLTTNLIVDVDEDLYGDASHHVPVPGLARRHVKARRARTSPLSVNSLRSCTGRDR